jgi:hypothetical protein
MSEEKELEKLRREIAELRDEVSLLEERHSLLNAKRESEAKLEEKILSVSTLKMDWLKAAKELESLKDNPDPELREALCIDFNNKMRINALESIHEDSDDVIILKAIAYETFYRACVATMENRNLRVKLAARDRFQEAVVRDKKEKIKKESEKREKVEQKELAKTPREKMIQGMMALGMSREIAEKQADTLMGAVKK